MTRSIRYLLLLLVLLASFSGEAQRRRVVRAPAAACTAALTQAFAQPGVASGMVHGVVHVGGSCTDWLAYSPVDWIQLERSGSDLLVTIAANPRSEARTATITIAGLPLTITQQPTVVVSPPIIANNLLRNGTFDTDTSFWGWEDRYPNGAGTAFWSAADANGSPSSGSFVLRNTHVGNAYQQLQCVNVGGGVLHDYGGAVRMPNPNGGLAAIVVLEFKSTGCTGTYDKITQQNIILDQAGTWVRKSYSILTKPTTRSMLFLVASGTTDGASFDVSFDDLYLKTR